MAADLAGHNGSCPQRVQSWLMGPRTAHSPSKETPPVLSGGPCLEALAVLPAACERKGREEMHVEPGQP